MIFAAAAAGPTLSGRYPQTIPSPRHHLLERDRELAAIAEMIGRVRESQPAIVFVEGPAGIGKTVLLDEAGDRAAASGMRVLSARGGELETHFPFGIVGQLFAPVLRSLPAEERRDVLSGAAALAAPVVAGAPAAPTAGEDRFSALSHGLYWLTANLAERGPMLLTVDDLHWADVSSLRFLVFLVRRLRGLPVALMMSTRASEGAPDPALLRQLIAETAGETLQPAALTERATARLIEDGLGAVPDERFVHACAAATGGTPFLLGELIATLAADGIQPTAGAAAAVSEVGPVTIGRATLRRVERLGAGAVALTRAVAVLGPAAETERVAQLAGLPPAVALQTADALVGAHILQAGPRLGFAHPIVRTAVYGDIPAGQRAADHARAAELLAHAGTDPDAVAAHLLLSAPAGQPVVIEQLRTAAQRALARGAPENAAAYLRRALAEGVPSARRADLLGELAEATRLTNPPEAVAQLREAVALAADAASRSRLTAALAQLLLFLGRWQEGAETVDAALSDLAGLDREHTVLLEGLACGYAAFDPRLVQRYDRGRPTLRAAIAAGVATARAPALLLAAITVLRGEEPTEVQELLEFGLDHGGLLAAESAFALVPQAFMALVFLDELQRATDLAQEMLTSVRSLGSMGGFLIAAAHLALIETRRGELRHAEAELRAAVDGMQELGLLFGLPSVLWFAADAIVERPELADIGALALELQLPPDFAATLSGAMLFEARGRLRSLQGDIAGAVDDLRAAWDINRALGFVNPSMSNLRGELALLLAGEDPVQARQLADSALDDARRVGLPRAIGVSLRTVGMLQGGEPGLARLREAVTILTGSPARLELARSLVELGAALRRANQRTAAREPLAAGLELAHLSGATRLAERARSELQATGARPRREVRSGADALTPSELRVAEMAAAGMSNPQIGQALFVTRNTIETHLRHTYRKLGIRRREALGLALESRRGPDATQVE